MDCSSAWIRGTELKRVINTYKPRHDFGSMKENERVPLDLDKYRYLLGEDRCDPVPFVVQGDLFVTIHDVDVECEVIDFTNIRFTRKALNSAILDAQRDVDAVKDDRYGTTKVSELARSINFGDSHAALGLSEAVCMWGGGGRVWGNLRRHYDRSELGSELSKWFLSAHKEEDPVRAIGPGIEIKGLGVSFASKHLRFLAPERFAVLDDVLHQGLGYALNAMGYKLFLRDLDRLSKAHDLAYCVADLEHAIFLMVRQIVRSM